jgi:hypothetical protein
MARNLNSTCSVINVLLVLFCFTSFIKILVLKSCKHVLRCTEEHLHDYKLHHHLPYLNVHTMSSFHSTVILTIIHIVVDIAKHSL